LVEAGLPTSACTAASKGASSEATKATSSSKGSTTRREITELTSATAFQHVGKHDGRPEVDSSSPSTHVVVVVFAVFDQGKNHKQEDEEQKKKNGSAMVSI
jgi:hypothetical protein